MLLSQDIIYYQLSRFFDATFTNRGQRCTEFERPRFFENAKSLTGHVVIIDETSIGHLDAAQLNFRNVLLICINFEYHCPEIICPSIITVNSNVAFTVVFNRLMEIFDNFTEWNHILERSLEYKDGFKKMIDGCVLLTPEAVCIMDQEFQYIAYSDFASSQGVIESPDGHDDAIPKHVLEEYYTLPDADQLKKRKEVFFHSFSFGDSFLKNLFYDETYIGRIAVRTYGCKEAALRYYCVVFDQLAEKIEELYGKYQTFWPEHATKNKLRYLLEECVRGETVSKQEWNSELIDIGWKTTDTLQLVQFSSSLRYDKNPYSKHIISETEKLWKGCIGFEYDEKTLLLVNLNYIESKQQQDVHQLLAYYVRENLLIAGVSRNFVSPDYIKGAYTQTMIAINEGLITAPTQWYFHFDDYTLPYMLSSSLGKFSNNPMYLCSEKLQILKQHDEKKGTDYYQTLHQYFTCRLNASEAAKKLYIHRSSFLNRLDRIQKLISIDFDSNDEILYLILSFTHMNAMDS